MFRPWRRTRAGHGAPSTLVADNQAVRTAEAIVCRAWALELLRRRDRLELDVSAAYRDCAAAGRRLTAAQCDGDPRKIELAHAALERALAAIRASTVTRDRALPELRAQVDRLNHVTRERMVWAMIRQLEHDGPTTTTASLEAPDPRTTRAGTELATQRERRFPRWLGRLLARSASSPQQS